MTVDANATAVTPRRTPPPKQAPGAGASTAEVAPAEAAASEPATADAPTAEATATEAAAAPAIAPDSVAIGAPATSAPGRRGSQLGLGAPAAAPAADATAQAPAEKGSWTVAVNLGTTQPGPGEQVGAERKAAELAKLSEQTKGTDVTIVAQETIKGVDGAPASLVTYTIQDGQVTKGDPTASTGSAAKDLENFIADTYAKHPSEKTALIQQSHGNGVNGLGTDAGQIGVEETAAAIRNGIETSNQGKADADKIEKLDVLNFDACLMAQTEVMDDMAKVADHVVASEDLENGTKGNDGKLVDGQDLNALLSKLLADPSMDGRQLGDAMVEAAAHNTTPLTPNPELPGADPANPGAHKKVDIGAGNNTIANFDMAAYDTYRQGLDTLGGALNEAMADPAAKAAIEDAIAQTPQMGAARDPNGTRRTERDVKAFTEQLDQAIADGSLPDPTGAIGEATRQTRADLDALVDSYHGVENGAGYEDLGGLGAFLPDQAYLDTAGGAGKENAGAGLQKLAADAREGFADPEKQPAEVVASTLKQLDGMLAAVRSKNTEAQVPLADVEAARRDLAAATTPEAQATALAELEQAANALAASPAYQRLVEQERAFKDRNLATTYANAQTGDGTGGWDQFTQALRAG